MQGAKSKEYINFFLNNPNQDEGDLEITQKFEQACSDPDKILPKYQNCELRIQNLSLTQSQFGEIDIQQIVN